MECPDYGCTKINSTGQCLNRQRKSQEFSIVQYIISVFNQIFAVMKIVKCRLFFILLGLVQVSVFAQTDRIGPAFELKPHPRILMFPSDEATIKTTIAADKTWSRL